MSHSSFFFLFLLPIIWTFLCLLCKFCFSLSLLDSLSLSLYPFSMYLSVCLSLSLPLSFSKSRLHNVFASKYITLTLFLRHQELLVTLQISSSSATLIVSSKKPMVRVFTSLLNGNFHLAIDHGKVTGQVSVIHQKKKEN